MTAEIFKSSYLKKEFEYFYQVLMPNLNTCGNCGVVKCFYCNTFTVSCTLCRKERRKSCFKYKSAVTFFNEHCNEEQWAYICNFLHDFFNISWISRWYFKDIKRPINSSIRNTCFIISSDDSIENSVKKNKGRTIYYVMGNNKYKFFSNH